VARFFYIGGEAMFGGTGVYDMIWSIFKFEGFLSATLKDKVKWLIMYPIVFVLVITTLVLYYLTMIGTRIQYDIKNWFKGIK
jgi:hypothetical protein